MSYLIRVYYDNELYSVDLSEKIGATIGSSNSDTVFVKGSKLKQGHFTIKNNGHGFVISGQKLLERQGNKFCKAKDEIMLDADKVFSTETDVKVLVAVHPKYQNSFSIDVTDKEIISFGKLPENTVVLNDKRTSARHCRIVRYPGGLYAEDLSSTNGTFVNGRRIQAKCRLNNFDRINFSIYQVNCVGDKIIIENIEKSADKTVPVINNKTVSVFG